MTSSKIPWPLPVVTSHQKIFKAQSAWNYVGLLQTEARRRFDSLEGLNSSIGRKVMIAQNPGYICSFSFVEGLPVAMFHVIKIKHSQEIE